MTTPPMPLPGYEPGVELLSRLSPYVRHCGDSRRPAWRMGGRKLLDYLLVYIAEGTGRFGVGEEIYEARPGDLFWIPPDTHHEMEGYAPGMHCPYVHFDLIYRPGVCHWDFSIPVGMYDLSEFKPLMHPPMTRFPELCFPGRIRAPNNPRVGGLIQEVSHEATRALPFAALRLSGLMMQIIAELLRGQAGLSNELSAHIPSLEASVNYIHRHLDQDLPVEDLAELCSLSVGHFRHLFAQHLGRSPRAYIRHARIERAKSLMVGSSISLTEIARRTVFSTVHNLSRAFRAVEGLAPSLYRCCGKAVVRVEGRGRRPERSARG